MSNTNSQYGVKRRGNSRYVIVAPHGGGDDLYTAELSDKLAAELDGSLVANTRFVKPTNSRAARDGSNVEDFN